jgi:hypothetical protein
MWAVIATSSPLHPRYTDPEPVVQEAEWTQAQILRGAEKLSPNQIRPPDLDNNSLFAE